MDCSDLSMYMYMYAPDKILNSKGVLYVIVVTASASSEVYTMYMYMYQAPFHLRVKPGNKAN